jgi:hypothetical protein
MTVMYVIPIYGLLRLHFLVNQIGIENVYAFFVIIGVGTYLQGTNEVRRLP